MTRKKLGLGLLETFSENCEVCADRGVIVHHDPVVKHRSNGDGRSNGNGGGNGQSQGNRRQRGGGNGQSQSAPPAPNVTHSIPEGAKSALAQIAASTLAPSLEPVEVAADAGSAEAVQSAAPERAKKPRKKRDSDRKGPKSPAEALLDSVLDALPEPKAPGQGRGRRRVTTAALTGTPVSVNNDASAAPVATADPES